MPTNWRERQCWVDAVSENPTDVLQSEDVCLPLTDVQWLIIQGDKGHDNAKDKQRQKARSLAPLKSQYQSGVRVSDFSLQKLRFSARCGPVDQISRNFVQRGVNLFELS